MKVVEYMRTFLVAVGIGATALLGSAQASTTYFFTGDFYTSFNPVTGDNPAVPGAYDILSPMSITGSLTVGMALAANLNNHNLLLDANFEDVMLTDTRFSIDFAGALGSKQVRVGTDALGAIDSWNISLQNQSIADTPAGGLSIQLQIFGNSFGGQDISQVTFCETAGCLGSGAIENAQVFTAGSWSQTGVPAIPLPAALPLFGTGLGILGFIGWRRRRKAAAWAARHAA